MPVALVTALALVLGPAAAGAAPDDTGVAIVRGDGTLQPLVRRSGANWTPLPATEAAGPWSVWLFDDPAVRASPFTARTARPAAAAAGAGACLALSGVAPGELPVAGSATAGGAAAIVALALSGSDVRPDLPVIVAADSDLARQLTARAAAAFHRAEDEMLTLEAEELPSGFPRFSLRRERPIRWTLVARQGVAQGTAKTYYLEGYKDYEGFRSRTDAGPIRTTGHVFVQMNGAREIIDAEVDLSDVPGTGSVFRRPLAAIPWPEMTAWLFATRGPDGAHLEILELMTGTIRPRSVWQGPDGCERGIR